MKTFISILDCDPLNLEKTLVSLKSDGVKNIHLDVIDTSFVNTISFGVSTINAILEHDFNFDLHFMIGDPLKILQKIKLSHVRRVFVHYGADFSGIREVVGGKMGIAVNPGENVKIDDACDTYLLMSVRPGYGSQKYISVAKKISECKRHGKIVGVDGGINIETVDDVVGADFVVVGSAFFGSENKATFLRDMENK